MAEEPFKAIVLDLKPYHLHRNRYVMMHSFTEIDINPTSDSDSPREASWTSLWKGIENILRKQEK